MRRLLALPVVLALAVPGSAAAAWSPPQALGPVSDYVTASGLTATHTGGALLAWSVQVQPPQLGGTPGGPTPRDRDGVEGRSGVLTADGSVRTSSRVARRVVAGPVLRPDGSALVVTTTQLPSVPRRGRQLRLRLERLGADGRLAPLLVIAQNVDLTQAALGADAYGRAVIAWAEVGPVHSERGRYAFQSTYRLRTLSVSTSGHAVGTPQTLETSHAYDTDHGGQVALAVDGIGRSTIAFATAHGGKARTVDLFSRYQIGRFGPRQVAGPQEGFAQLAVAITPQARTLVAWGAQDGGEEANMPWRIRAAIVSPSGRSIARGVLDPGQAAERPQGTVAAVALPDGSLAVGWSAIVGRAHPVRVVIASPVGRFGRVQDLAGDGALGALAADRESGALLATWATVPDFRGGGTPPPMQAMAALRAPGATAFGAAEAIAAPDDAQPPLAAFLSDGRPVVAWGGRPGGADPSSGVARTSVLRVAVRSAP